MSIEEKYFDAILTGKIKDLETLLNAASEIGLDINAVDANGHNAYVIAINEGFDVIIKILLRFHVQVRDALLFAVDVGAEDAVNTLCSYASTLPEKECRAIIDCRCSTDNFPKIITPIIQAALNNNFTIVKILLGNGVRVPEPETDFELFTAQPGTLERSNEMLIIYRALASEAYISGNSINPIQAAFDLTGKMRSLSDKLEEFRSEFTELAHEIEVYAAKLLDKTRDTEEILTVLTFTEGQTIEPALSGLAMIEYAIDCSQKNFVAHPNCQSVVINQFYRHLISLRETSTLMQILIHLLVMVSFPFMSIAFLVYPSNAVVRLIQVPYVKIVMSIASEILFLVLLVYDSVNDSQEGAVYTAIQILITLWIIGKTWAEVERMTSNYERFFGRDFMTSLYNFMVLVLLFAVFMLRFVVYLRDMNDEAHDDMQKRSLDETMLQESAFLTESIPSLKDHILLSLNQTENNVNSYLDDNLDTFLADIIKSLTCATPTQVISETCADPTDRLHIDSNDPILVIEALYAFAIVLSVLRLSSIAVINEFVGPLQISLGGMCKDIAVFGVIFCVVWLTFSIGMNQLHHIFQAIDYDSCIQSGADGCEHGAFSSILTSLETFYWTLLGNVDFKTIFIGTGHFVFSEWVSIIFFASYVIVAVVILLNALIAMMSNTYCTVEENADTEWKFFRTATWMTYMNNNVSLPPPFNIIPSPWKICKKTQIDTQETLVQHDEEYFKRKYKKLVNKLVERFVHESTADENSIGSGLSKNDIQGLKSDIISFKYECGNILEVLSQEMDETIRQTTITKNKLEVTKIIQSNAETINRKLTEQKVSFSDIHTDLRDLQMNRYTERTVPGSGGTTTTTTTAPVNRRPPPLKRQVSSRVSVLSGLFEQAVDSGSLSEEAQEIFQS